MRKLASIKKVSNILPIEGKDRIELAIIDGWQVIVKKGEYIAGDWTVFVEIDSVLPDKPEFEFLRSKKFRIKTLKLSGVLSQGICFPLSILPQSKYYELDEDVTDILEIKKYEPQESTSDSEDAVTKDKTFKHPAMKWMMKFKVVRKLLLPKKQQRGFPEFIAKTDETRIQNIPGILNNKNILFVVREKVDGQSGTFFLKKMDKKWFWQKQSYDFGVCSRNLRLWNEDNGSQWFVAKKYNIKKVLEDLIGDNDFVAIQGECISPKVQGNKYKVAEPDLYAFNVIFPTGKICCLLGESLLQQYGIKWCPMVDEGLILPDAVNEMLDYATGTSKLHPTLREGVVLRNYGKNISFKAVSPDFLIKNDE